MTESTETRIRVIVAMDFSDEIIERLREISPRLQIEHYWPDVPETAWAEAEVLYTLRHFPLPEQAPMLRWVQLHTAGMDTAKRQPIIQAEDVYVTSASGIHASHMAEYCLMMMLAFEYKLPQMIHFKDKAEWPKNNYRIFNPYGLRNKTIGIAGYGSIGREVARVAAGVGMTVLASKRDVKVSLQDAGYLEEGLGDPEGEIPERLYPSEALAVMARDCDYLVIALPLTEETHHRVNEEVFAAMKPSGVLINVSRGPVVDEAALISALAAEKIGGAALDVFEEEPLPNTSPLWNLDNVIISPHIAGNHVNYHEKVAAVFSENLRRYLNKQPLLNLLDRAQGY